MNYNNLMPLIHISQTPFRPDLAEILDKNKECISIYSKNYI